MRGRCVCVLTGRKDIRMDKRTDRRTDAKDGNDDVDDNSDHSEGKRPDIEVISRVHL